MDRLLRQVTPDRTSPAPSIPIFAGHVEAKAAEALNVLIFAHGGGDAPIHAEQLVTIRASLTSLVDCLFPINGDYADFAGADSLDGIDYIHPTHVASLAVVIGRELGMPRSELINVAMAAALMNVGYLALRRSLLDQPRRLLEGEWEEHIRTHPDRGVKLLARSGLADDCLRAIEHHHERWDGSGYPAGLRGDAISRHARIIAVADTYVSLRSIRPHRPPVDAEVALEEVALGRGKIYDPKLVDAFEDVIARFTGITRPDRTESGASSAARATAEAHATAQRDGADTIDAATEATVEPSYTADDADEPPPPPGARRARRTNEAATGTPAEPRSAAGATPGVERLNVAPTALPRSRHVAQSGPASVAPPRRRPRRRSSGATARRVRPRHGLFAPKLYVDAAVDGRWPLDRLRR